MPVCASVATQSGGCAYLQSVRAQEPRSHSRHAYRGREVGLKRWDLALVESGKRTELVSGKARGGKLGRSSLCCT